SRNVAPMATDEHVIIRPTGAPNPHNGEVTVSMFGATQQLVAVLHILAHAGNRDNTIDAQGVGAMMEFIGGDGNDVFFAGLRSVTFWGGDGLNELTGSPEDDFLYGGADRDIIIGKGGNDFISSGAGDDLLIGDFPKGSAE